MSNHQILQTKLRVETQENETELRGSGIKIALLFNLIFIPLKSSSFKMIL